MGKHRLFVRVAKLPLGVYLFALTMQASIDFGTTPMTLWSKVHSQRGSVKPSIKEAFYEEKHDSEGWWLCKRRKQRKILLTSETTGNLHTLLHSLATCTLHVHRGGGCGSAPHGTNWKKHRGSENESVVKNHPTRQKRPEEPTRPTAGMNESGVSVFHGFY